MTPTPRRELKKHILRLVIAVAVLDTVVIGLYYALSIQSRPVRTQQTFVGVWVALTLIVVTTFMKRIRQVRTGGIR